MPRVMGMRWGVKLRGRKGGGGARETDGQQRLQAGRAGALHGTGHGREAGRRRDLSRQRTHKRSAQRPQQTLWHRLAILLPPCPPLHQPTKPMCSPGPCQRAHLTVTGLPAASASPCSISGMWRCRVTPYALMPSVTCRHAGRQAGTQTGRQVGKGHAFPRRGGGAPAAHIVTLRRRWMKVASDAPAGRWTERQAGC